MAIAASVCLVTVLWFAAPFAFKADESRSDGYALIDAMSMQQQQQVNSLLASYESTTALTEDWQEQLKELDDAADVIKAALKDDPDNSALIKMLHHVYQQQIALIERVHAPKWQQI
jgi:negative regulator of sigma E activity